MVTLDSTTKDPAIVSWRNVSNRRGLLFKGSILVDKSVLVSESFQAEESRVTVSIISAR